MTLSPYLPLDVIDAFHKVDGRRWFVRDTEESHVWVMVEYVGRPGRLTCWCDDGQAHAESPGTERECVHLRAVVDQIAIDRQSSCPPAPINVGSFVD